MITQLGMKYITISMLSLFLNININTYLSKSICIVQHVYKMHQMFQYIHRYYIPTNGF